MLDFLLQLIVCAAILLLFTRIQSILEHVLVSPSSAVVAIAQPKDLHLFKRIRFFLLVMCSFEHSLLHLWSLPVLLAGLLLVAVGSGLRIAAIIALGPMWSFNVVQYANHYYVTHGVYRFVKHPAYLGNCYLPGLCLVSCSPISAVLSLLFVAWFFRLRVARENAILIPLETSECENGRCIMALH